MSKKNNNKNNNSQSVDANVKNKQPKDCGNVKSARTDNCRNKNDNGGYNG